MPATLTFFGRLAFFDQADKCRPFASDTRMRIKATKTTAALAGAWSALGLSLVETFMRNRPPDAVMDSLTNLVAVVVFFFGPAAAFVFGVDQLRGPRNPFTHTREFWREWRQVWLRMLFWFLSGVAAGIAYSYW